MSCRVFGISGSGEERKCIGAYVQFECIRPFAGGNVRIGWLNVMKEGLRYSDTILPEGIVTVHPRFAISWRNKWMLKQSDYVVTYITHSWGGAAQFAEMAERQAKHVVKLFDYR